MYDLMLDFFLRFIVPENLRYFLSNYNTSEALYFGHRFKAYLPKGYMQGGSGQLKM